MELQAALQEMGVRERALQAKAIRVEIILFEFCLNRRWSSNPQSFGPRQGFQSFKSFETRVLRVSSNIERFESFESFNQY